MDTLARTKRLEALGFERPKAEGLVQMVKQSIDEEVAKKVDLLELKAELKLDIADMKGDIADMKVEIGGMKGEIGEMRGDIKALDEKINSMTSNLKLWLGGLMISLFALGVEYKPETSLLKQILEKVSQEKGASLHDSKTP